MSEETLWTRAYGDEYWADVTSPLFFSLLGGVLPFQDGTLRFTRSDRNKLIDAVAGNASLTLG